eukprot:TRINITY_DN30836_c0_g1_i1.p1 TRINITY_DN30836_c0_g1~~TRINITY_DN30836_c0_g1_i1.p1  ORF type:complete len:122 (-),score=14.06 TRINITY_DN30836_c0_g1_i1:29-394(-)
MSRIIRITAEYLVTSKLEKTYDTEKLNYVVVAMLHDKDIPATLEVLAPMTTHWYPASLQGPRAATAAELCQSLPEGIKQHTTPVAAFEAALASAQGDDVVLVVGSFHTVGEVLEHWQKKGN